MDDPLLGMLYSTLWQGELIETGNYVAMLVSCLHTGTLVCISQCGHGISGIQLSNTTLGTVL